jgi:hypothetical protein
MTQTLRRPRHRRFISTISFITLLAMNVSCRGSSSSTAASNDKSVSVSGTLKDDDPTEFTQAAESVQIGGANLAESADHNISVYYVNPDGSETLAHKSTYAGNTFSISFRVPALRYVRITFQKGSVQFSTVLPGTEEDKTNLKTIVDRTSTIADKIFEIAAAKAKTGDQETRSAIGNGILAIPDLLQLAATIDIQLKQQIKTPVKEDPVNLTNLANSVITESTNKVNDLVSKGKTVSDVASTIRNSSFVMYGTYGASIDPGILAHRVNDGLDSKNVAYSTLMASNTSGSYSPTIAIYQIQATAFREAPSPEAAAEAANAPSLQTYYETTYQNCISGASLIAACYNDAYSPPPITDSSSGGGTAGGTSSESAPTHSAQGLAFDDIDLDSLQIGGDVTFQKASDETDLTSYVLYWGSDSTTKLTTVPQIAEISKSGVLLLMGTQQSNSTLSFTVATNTLVPSGATHFLVFTKNAFGEMSTGASVRFIDKDNFN